MGTAGVAAIPDFAAPAEGIKISMVEDFSPGDQDMLSALSVVLGLVAGTGAPPQEPGLHAGIAAFESLGEARRLAASEQHEEAVSRLRAILPQRKADGAAWLLLAGSLYELGRPNEALTPYRRALRLGAVDEANGRFALACCHAAAGDTASALEELAAALRAGYRWRTGLASDRRLRTLQGVEAFTELVAAAPSEGLTRDAGFELDLDHLLAEVRRAHWRYRREPLPAETKARAAQLRAGIPRLDDAGVVVGIQHVLASLGDGHSLVYPFGMRRGAMRRMPLDLYAFADGIYVIRADDAHRHLVGHEVAAFGTTAGDAAIEAIRPWVSCDNDQSLRWLAPIYLTIANYLVAAGISDSVDAVAMTTRDPNGELTRTEIACGKLDPRSVAQGLLPPAQAAAPPPPLHLRNLGTPFWMERLPEDGVVYVQLNRMLDGPDETLDAFARRLRGTLDDRAPAAVIVDLRHNAGGEGSLRRGLVRTLVHFEMAHAGRIVVLIGRNTFSAAQTFASDLEWSTDALFVGEPTGAGLTRVGDEAPFVLPSSGARGALASGFHIAPVGATRVALVPDVFVPLTSRAYFAGEDPALVAARQLAGRTR